MNAEKTTTERVRDRLRLGQSSVDDLVSTMGIDRDEVLTALGELERDGKASRVFNGHRLVDVWSAGSHPYN